MKAVSIQQFGGPEVLRVAEIEKPRVGNTDVLIRVAAAGVNYGDSVVRRGGAPVPVAMPLIPGCEVAGIVEQVGADVKSVAPGDRVVAPLFVAGRLDGGYAEFAAIAAELVFPIPDHVGFEQATAFAMQGLTAWLLLRQSPVEGRIVVVHAAAGGVGSLLVQLARQQGARAVIATAGSADKLALATRLGADSVVSYRADGWWEQVRDRTNSRGPDIIFESVGGEVRRRSLEILAPSGELAIFGATAVGGLSGDPLDGAQVGNLIARNQSIRGFSMWPLLPDRKTARQLVGQVYGALFELIGEGKLEPVIGGTYRLDEAVAAHQALEERRTVGKTVLLPFPDDA